MAGIQLDSASGCQYNTRMSTNITDDILSKVRQWAAEGTDLNSIQKKLQSECGLHLTYMEVRFLLLDHGIEIATEAKPAAEENPAPAEAPAAEAPASGVQVSLDELQLPGTLLSGKASFPGGASGSWQIDQLGRFGWSELSGQPSPDEMRDFQQALTGLLGRM